MLFFSFHSGTVVTGRVTRGKLKTGTEIEIIGYGKSFKAKVNGNSLIVISSGQENLYLVFLYFVFISSFYAGMHVYFESRRIVKVCLHASKTANLGVTWYLLLR